MDKQAVARSRVSRLYAIQILYQLSFHIKEDVKSEIAHFLLHYQRKDLPLYDEKLLYNLVEGTLTSSKDSKKFFEPHVAREWNSMENVLLVILQMAYFECLYNSDVPVKAIINQYTVVSSFFFVDSKVNFIAGVLRNSLEDLRK